LEFQAVLGFYLYDIVIVEVLILICQSWWCWRQRICRFHGRLFVVV